MKVAALLCGIIGGVIQLVITVAGLGFGVVVASFGGGGAIAGASLAAMVMAIIGIVGGALALAKPLVAAILMAVAAVLGFVFISLGFAIGGILLLIGAALAFIPWYQERQA